MYVHCYSFPVRSFDEVPVCFRCLSLDHTVRDCRVSGVVCRHCGESGHKSNVCTNEVMCRNCAFRKRPAKHLILSQAWPACGTMLARVAARH